MARGRKALLIVGAVVAALAVTIALGPRPEVDLAVEVPTVPADPAALDAFVAASEARFGDVRPGNEKRVVWADPNRPARTEVALVYLHGFSASRREISPVCEQVAEALGANLYFARLRGHGRTGPAMLDGSVNAWLEDALEALAIGRRLGRRVVVIGTSTGATLATWLAARPDAQDLHALVLVSPNFQPRSAGARILSWPWGGLVARLVIGEERGFEPRNELHDRFWTTRYPTEALVPMMALVDLVAEIDPGRIPQPVLMIHSEHDGVVDPVAARERFEAFPSSVKQRVVVTDDEDSAHHVIAGDIISPATTPRARDAILAFLARL